MSYQATVPFAPKAHNSVLSASLLKSLRPRKCTAQITEHQILSCRRYRIFRKVDNKTGDVIFGQKSHFPHNKCPLSSYQVVETRYKVELHSAPVSKSAGKKVVEACDWDLMGSIAKYLEKNKKGWKLVGLLVDREGNKTSEADKGQQLEYAVIERIRKCDCKGKLMHKTLDAKNVELVVEKEAKETVIEDGEWKAEWTSWKCPSIADEGWDWSVLFYIH